VCVCEEEDAESECERATIGKVIVHHNDTLTHTHTHTRTIWVMSKSNTLLNSLPLPKESLASVLCVCVYVVCS
jgi:hypothetical protein